MWKNESSRLEDMAGTASLIAYRTTCQRRGEVEGENTAEKSIKAIRTFMVQSGKEEAMLEAMRRRTCTANPEEEVQCGRGCGYQVTWIKRYCCFNCKKEPGEHGQKCQRLKMPNRVLGSYFWTVAGAEWIGNVMACDIRPGDVVEPRLWSKIASFYENGWPDAQAAGYFEKRAVDASSASLPLGEEDVAKWGGEP
jgi:hypothetical protein